MAAPTDSRLPEEEEMSTMASASLENVPEISLVHQVEKQAAFPVSTEEVRITSEEVTESHEEVGVTQGEVRESHEEVTVTHRDVTESYEEVGVSHEEVTASHEEVTESHGEVTESHEEAHEEVRVSHEEVKESHETSCLAEDRSTQEEEGKEGQEDGPITFEAPPASEEKELNAEPVTEVDGSVLETASSSVLEPLVNSPPEVPFVYMWPASGGAGSDIYLLMHQLESYLGMEECSLLEKYAAIVKRSVEPGPEKAYLGREGIEVDATDCAAVKCKDVLEAIEKDLPDQFKKLSDVTAEKQKEREACKQKETSVCNVAADKLKAAHYVKRAVRSAAAYNSLLMKERREERKCYYDSQTHIIQYPRSAAKLTLNPSDVSGSAGYPVAVLHGQFADHYERYSPCELNYLPLNTVMHNPPKALSSLYGRMSPDNSTQGESGTSAENSAAVSEASESEEEPESIQAPSPKKVAKRRQSQDLFCKSICSICMKYQNVTEQAELCVKCPKCKKTGHPSCLGLTEAILVSIQTYDWLCMECKVCTNCNDPNDEDKMLFCDQCDRGYHTFCVGLEALPEGNWDCPMCTGATKPAPAMYTGATKPAPPSTTKSTAASRGKRKSSKQL